ncbi:hypothetical protein BN946_scf184305.g5 [Trametes cinnabarina]|uniref:Sorbose reductase sou1 n=1 Tax=Pycnoporus cinnabarinus TaxID=5643 RepID=A0A060SVZ4_PYCCI|nr:hypothetical protein BN946_scf184305.g5 [Trametes cinnabarina]
MSVQGIPGLHPSYGPVGVARALHDFSETPSPTLFSKEFSLADKVALVTGGNSGIGLESALAFVEAGARVVYCVDIAPNPSAEWTKAHEFASRLQGKAGEGRLDLDGVLYTAQAAGQQMKRFNQGGSIILLSSVLGHQSMPSSTYLAYQMAKGGVLQLARSLACELAPIKIRVNSISPGFLRTNMMAPLFSMQPEAESGLATLSPTGRIGEPHELRGVVTFLASDASSWCTGSDIFVDGAQHAW